MLSFFKGCRFACGGLLVTAAKARLFLLTKSLSIALAHKVLADSRDSIKVGII